MLQISLHRCGQSACLSTAQGSALSSEGKCRADDLRDLSCEDWRNKPFEATYRVTRKCKQPSLLHSLASQCKTCNYMGKLGGALGSLEVCPECLGWQEALTVPWNRVPECWPGVSNFNFVMKLGVNVMTDVMYAVVSDLYLTLICCFWVQ